MKRIKLGENMLEISFNSVPTSVDRWYSRQDRSWIIQLKDQQGNQIGNAIYVCSKKEAITEEDRLKKEYNI